MKRLFDRFTLNSASRSGDEAPSAPADDEGFFATQFMERAESMRANSAWNARALVVGATALDPEVGLTLLLKNWGRDALMASLPPQDHQKLIDHLDFVSVPPGRELIIQDEKGDYALIVLEGLVAVDRVQPTGARARLAEAREGDVLGEMSLLDELAIEEPRLGMALMTSTARRLSLRMRQLSARLGALLTAG